jgi:predicted ATP-grasp superfamily ATP-dependent carboligase
MLGLPAAGLWAQVPHYAAAMPYPAGAAALLDGLELLADVRFPVGDLVDEASATRQRLDELVADSREHVQLVRQLEAQVDAQERRHEGPGIEAVSGDELAAELERFLRDQDRD